MRRTGPNRPIGSRRVARNCPFSNSAAECAAGGGGMEIIGRIAKFHDELKEWRHDIHAHPELGFEEQRTSDLVAQKLAEFGCEVFRGIGRTGVVGRLRAGDSVRSIGLRADMDCLPIEEATNLPYSSRNNGRMHACGHDGHTTMLLGAARYLPRPAISTARCI